MKSQSSKYFALVIALVGSIGFLGNNGNLYAEDDFSAQLDAGLANVAKFEFGQDPKVFQEFEKTVLKAANDPAKRKLAEERLLATLDGSTRAGSDLICRWLRTIASERSIPKLESMLVDPALSHMARYALGRMDAPGASIALHRGLHKTSGDLQAGILNTLGRRGYRDALPDVAKLLSSPDGAVANAAAGALGGIGGAESVAALQAARSHASPVLRRTIDDALLASAEQFLANGERLAAAVVYGSFYGQDRPTHHRIAALRGLVASGSGNATHRVIEAIRGPDPQMRASAIAFAVELEGQQATRALAELLPTLPADSQVLMLSTLSARGDAPAVFAILAAVRSGHETVRAAAYQALGVLGDASTVDLLVAAAATGGELEQRAARASLLQLSGERVDESLALTLGSSDSASKIERLRALSSRQAKATIGRILPLAWDADAAVRNEAISTLGNIGGESELPLLVALAASPRDPADRERAEQAIVNVYRRVPTADAKAAPVIAALGSASGEAKVMLVRLLGKTGSHDAVHAVRGAVSDHDATVRATAVRTLAEWPDPSAAKDLLAVAGELNDAGEKAAVVKGYIRMASHSKDAPGMYRQAMELAKGPASTAIVLEGLGTVSSSHTLTLAEQYLDTNDAAVQAAAGRSVVKIASGLPDKEASLVKTALRHTVAKVEDSGVRKEAQEVLNRFEQYEGYLLDWMVAGPFMERGKSSRQIYDAVFTPEKPGAPNVHWKRLRRGVGAWSIDLEAGVGALDNCAAYVRTRVHSPTDQAARLELASDDSIKAWVNGETVHAGYHSRSLAPRSDVVDIKLKEGWNDVLLKLVDHGGGWAFACRVRKPDGTALDGLEVKRR